MVDGRTTDLEKKERDTDWRVPIKKKKPSAGAMCSPDGTTSTSTLQKRDDDDDEELELDADFLAPDCPATDGAWLASHVLNAIGRPSSTRLFPLLGKAHPKWWHETEIVKFDPKRVFSFLPDGES